MLSFKNENVISKYDVVLQNTEMASSIVNEILGQEEYRKTDVSGIIWTNYGKFERTSVKLLEYGFEQERQSPESTLGEYSRGCITTYRFSYPAPYTLALAAQFFDFNRYCDYSGLLKRSDRAESLINVLHGTDLNEVSLLLSCFNNNPQALDTYLRNYHPDLLYLRRYLECVYFRKAEEYPLEAVDRRSDIEISSMNSQVVRKLSLPIEFRD